MDARIENKPTVTKNTATAERTERELVVTRTFNAPARVVFEAWTTADLMKRWWAPKSCGIIMVGCELDARTGGSYRFAFVLASDPSMAPMTFFGKYLEVTPHTRLVWTNEEDKDGAVTTVTLEEQDGKTRLTMRDLFPSKEALDAAIASGSTSGTDETFAQLDELLITLGT